jgi:putative membrane protein
MMNGHGTGISSGGWIVMLVIGATLIGLIAFAIVRLLGAGAGAGTLAGGADTEPTPREILDRRLARGEIDEETHTAVADRLAHGAGR